LSLLSKRVFSPLLIPAIVILASALIVWKWPELLKQIQGTGEFKAVLLILPFFPYAFFVVGIILGWRFSDSGMVLTALVLGLSYFSIGSGRTPESVGWVNLSDVARILLPLNLGFFATLTRRHLLTPLGLSCLIVVAFQVAALLVLFPTGNAPLPQPGRDDPGGWSQVAAIFSGSSVRLQALLNKKTFFGYQNTSALAILFFSSALLFLFVRFIKSRDALSAGFLGALVAAFLGFSGHRLAPSPMVYFSAAGLILITMVIETSFFMAYTDELTGLPGRRRLNETLSNLGRKYAIAMIDIDHFKKFNDQYGHKTGDQVLKMIASKLKEITGGAKVFRYGGEEFTAIFPGKGVEEAMPHLDVYRKIIEAMPFVIRGKARRKGSVENRGKVSSRGQKRAKVTVSIGVAAPGKAHATPEKVLKAADKILYKAKKAGRNRVAS
jgi:diguanylate cyclase (GGDEF)-like protein